MGYAKPGTISYCGGYSASFPGSEIWLFVQHHSLNGLSYTFHDHIKPQG